MFLPCVKCPKKINNTTLPLNVNRAAGGTGAAAAAAAVVVVVVVVEAGAGVETKGKKEGNDGTRTLKEMVKSWKIG